MPNSLDLTSVVAGALLTLGVSLFTLRYQHRNEIGRESAAKRRELLEKVAMEVAAYMSAPTAYSHALGVFIATRRAERAPSATDVSPVPFDSAEALKTERTALISDSWQHADEPQFTAVRAALDNLSEAHERLACAIYWASLTADAALGHVLQEFWSVANVSYLMFRRRFVDIDVSASNEWMERLSARSEAVRQELGRAYVATFNP